MKKYILAGFANYAILNNGTVTHTDGSLVEQTAKDAAAGIVRLEASEDAPVSEKYPKGLEKGKKYGFKLEGLMGSDNAWTEVEGVQTPAPVKTEAQILRDEFNAKKKALATKAKALQDSAAKETDQDKAMALFVEWKSVKAELDALTPPAKDKAPERVYTPEEQALIDAYVAKVADIEKAKEALKTMREELAAMQTPEGYRKAGGGGGGENPQRAAHVGYENAQAIREMYSIGRYGNPGTALSTKEIADKFGCATSAVNYYVNYLQHKLKTGDVAHTPLVNKYYPADLWPNGAPLAEERIKETNDRYKLPESRIAGNPKAISTGKADETVATDADAAE